MALLAAQGEWKPVAVPQNLARLIRHATQTAHAARGQKEAQVRPNGVRRTGTQGEVGAGARTHKLYGVVAFRRVLALAPKDFLRRLVVPRACAHLQAQTTAGVLGCTRAGGSRG